MVLPPPLIPRDILRGSAGLAVVMQHQPQSQLPSQAYASYIMVAPQVSFSFRVVASYQFIMLYVGTFYDVCLLLLGSHVAAMFTSGGSTIWFCTATTLWSIPLGGICSSLWFSITHTRSALSGCYFHCFEW